MSSAGDPDAQFSTFKHHVKSRTTWKKLFIIKETSGKSGIKATFSMTLECMVTKTLKANDDWQPVQVLYEGGSATRTFKANHAMGILGDQEG